MSSSESPGQGEVVTSAGREEIDNLPTSWVQCSVSGVVLSYGLPKGEMFAWLMTVELADPCLKNLKSRRKINLTRVQRASNKN